MNVTTNIYNKDEKSERVLRHTKLKENDEQDITETTVVIDQTEVFTSFGTDDHTEVVTSTENEPVITDASSSSVILENMYYGIGNADANSIQITTDMPQGFLPILSSFGHSLLAPPYNNQWTTFKPSKSDDRNNFIPIIPK